MALHVALHPGAKGRFAHPGFKHGQHHLPLAIHDGRACPPSGSPCEKVSVTGWKIWLVDSRRSVPMAQARALCTLSSPRISGEICSVILLPNHDAKDLLSHRSSHQAMVTRVAKPLMRQFMRLHADIAALEVDGFFARFGEHAQHGEGDQAGFSMAPNDSVMGRAITSSFFIG